MNGRKMQQRLRAVWDHAAPVGGAIPETPWRYVPRAYGPGTGWGVWDRKLGRYVDNDLMNLTVKALREELPNYVVDTTISISR